MNSPQSNLFAGKDKVHYGENHRHQNLFLPRFMHKLRDKHLIDEEDMGRAHEIFIKWADLEDSGKLQKKKESALRGEFISDIFGEALGYSLFSEGKTDWNVESEYVVNGGAADVAIGVFKDGKQTPPLALVELKGPKANLDRDRSSGRTAVQQCWDYLNVTPDCPWGIVCNFVSFRLYHRSKSSNTYQLYVLQELRDRELFEQFYYLFSKDGLIPTTALKKSRAQSLLDDTGERQQAVGTELYEAYDSNRRNMIRHLQSKQHNKPLENAIHISQKLLDRIIFVAFCEDRNLLPENSIDRASKQIAPFSKVTNPRWQNFLELFHAIDKGHKKSGISAYNGGLFRQDDEVDNLQLDDQWTNFFSTISKYDFRDEVDVDILGHLFEKSVSDIGRIRLAGLFGAEVDDTDTRMDKSAERKRGGIYYTPPEFTSFITHHTVGDTIKERFEAVATILKLSNKDIYPDKPNTKVGEYWKQCLAQLRNLKIVDPACGSGAFLIAAYNFLADEYSKVIDSYTYHTEQSPDELLDQVPDIILSENLFGVDLSPEAVEISQLALWLRSARQDHTLADLSDNIVCGNSVVADPEVHPKAMTWEKTFPSVFAGDKPGFDCVIGNPPWERMKLQEREFFDGVDSDIASAVNAATRRKLIDKLKKNNPNLYERYVLAKESAEKTLDHVRNSGKFPLTGKGDINTYAIFAELAQTIVAVDGRVGLLVPSGIATDHTTKDFFASLTDTNRLSGLYDFENKRKIFPDVDGRLKFTILLFGGKEVTHDSVDFVFFAHQMADLEQTNRHIQLSAKDFKLLNPNTRTCPVFRTRTDADLTRAIYRRVPILIDKNRKEGGNPWGIKFFTMFHQTNDAELFHTADELKEKRFKQDGPNWKKGKKTFLPLYEAKMIQMYDHRAASVDVREENWFRQGQTIETDLVPHQNPEFAVVPRWWASQEEIKTVVGSKGIV